nr:hypothetical protein [Tanacetum cinerariifolium]
MHIRKQLITEAIQRSKYYKQYVEMAACKVQAKEGGKKKMDPKVDKPVKPAPAKQSKPATTKQPKPKHIKEKSEKPTPLQKADKGKVIKVQNVKSSLKLVEEPDEEQAHPSPEPQGAGVDTDKINSEGDTKILNIGGEQEEDVANKEDLEGKTTEINEGQAGSDPGTDPGPMHDDFVATMYPQVHECCMHPDEEHVHMENPLSSTGTLSSMKNLDAYTYEDKFFNEKPTQEGLRKINMETEVKSMVTVLIHQASLSVPPLSIPVIDPTPPKPVPSTTQAPIFTATTTTKTTTTTTLPPPLQQQISLVPDLASRVLALEQVYVPHMINQTINEVVKEAIYVALQAPLRDRFRELPEEDMKEILHQRMFKSGFYKLLPEHVALYEALEASMEHANRDEFLAEKEKSYEEYEDEYVRTPPSYESTNDENEHVYEEEYDRVNKELYKDMNVKLNDVEHEEEGKGDAEKTDAGHDDVTQETTYDQVEDDAHVILITAYVSQKTEVLLQSSPVSSDFATQFLNLDNVLPIDNEIISM